MRKLIARLLRSQSLRYIRKYAPRIVVITGSVGKTSTTQAIAQVLASELTVTSTIGNYNTDIGVPCSIFGRTIPRRISNPFAWGVIFLRNELALLFGSGAEALVLELGTDTPGEIASFAWLKPHVAVVTAVAPEHMEFFKTIEAVAQEELAVADYSARVVVNGRMIDERFLAGIDMDTLTKYDRGDIAGYDLTPKDLRVVGAHSIDSIAAALAVGDALELSNQGMVTAAREVLPKPGRMSELKGINSSRLIDDTYNSSPEAVIAALDYIYTQKAPQKIALLGNMNEFGDASRDAHIAIGEYCDPDKLDLVVTLGPDANAYTAPAARAHGCTVEETNTPYEAGELIKRHMKEGVLVLLKGSQNKVFAEEATKILLADPSDERRLVRQSIDWLEKKQRNFNEA